jgi:hypothetical protein
VPEAETQAEVQAEGDTAGGGDAPEPLVRIWERLAQPFSMAETIDGLLGLTIKVANQFIGTKIATSPEAETLLDSMTKTMRSLATSMQTHAQRCMGDVRGPILWSETMSARASSNGAEDVFVCATPGRAYDITENQILVYALNGVREGAVQSAIVSDQEYDDALLRRARAQGERARHYLQHPSLRSVSLKAPDGRALKRTRSGKSHKSYQPALDMLERLRAPLSVEELLPYVDRRTKAQHDVLMTFVDKLEAGGTRLPPFRAEAGVVYAGPIQYRHPRTLGNVERLSGIILGNLLVDVPDRLRERSRSRAEFDLKARAQGRRCMVIMNRDDIEEAFTLAATLARR